MHIGAEYFVSKSVRINASIELINKLIAKIEEGDEKDTNY